ncbi:phasin family protein [Cohnella hongkongensis]|uniref:Phasin family protein n=1 Tax=Cohnella hongkongensis TaxID=178337 RepID=A0ABV9FBX3_9BACL
MKDTIGKALSLGLGLAVAGKEQVEKTIEELVKKGELSKAESGSLAEELVRKGEEAKSRMEELVRARIQALLGDGTLATKEDVARLEQRLTVLEQRLAGN